MSLPGGIALYCDQGDVERLMSTYGVMTMLDDDDSGAIDGSEDAAMADCLTEATETINYYCWERYTPAIMATSNWVNRAATKFAAYCLRQRRNNEVPEALLEAVEKLEDMLQQILEGKAKIPNLPMRFKKSVVWSNTRFVPEYSFRCIRVIRSTSSKHSQTALPQSLDMQDLFTQEGYF